MVSVRDSFARVRLRAAAAAAAGLLAAGCGASLRTPGITLPVAPELAAVAGDTTTIELQRLPLPPGALAQLEDLGALIVGGEHWRLPSAGPDDATIAALRSFVHRGGRLLLLGYASRLVHDLGIEPRAPDVREPWRWGFDARSVTGQARLGFELVSGRLPELGEGLRHAAGREHSFFLTGGAPCCEPLCVWHAVEPQRGEVLGRLATERDGAAPLPPAAVLAHWEHGAGAVLALGIEPDLRSADPDLAHNGAQFLARALDWLGAGTRPRRIGYWLLPSSFTAGLPDRLPPPEEREVPGARQLAQWGWVAPAFPPAGVRSLAEIRDGVLLSSFEAGADLLLLDLVDAADGLPLPWRTDDPLRRPPSYRGGAFAPAWQPPGVGELAAEAHARGVQLHVGIDPQPTQGPPVERVALLRFLARELADLRRLGERAVDGFALRDWFADTQGLGTRMLADFRPEATLLTIGETARANGAPRALDALDGRFGARFAFGLGNGCRDLHPADLFPAGVLDATARRDGARPVGGSFGDWIAMQAADFVRQRTGRGGAMLWRAFDPATLGRDTTAYVHGVSTEPLTAAVATACTTVGVDGWRDAQRALAPVVPPGFGPLLPVPAATVMLQNNRLRLCGSGGALLWDPRGLALLTPDEGATVLAREFLVTRLFGARPDASSLRLASVDLLAGGRRAAGGFGAECTIDVGGSAPAQLAFGAAPEWPQRASFRLPEESGWFDLAVRARATAGRGVLAIGVDADVRWLLPFEDGRLTIERTLPLHLAHGGGRTLWLEVVDGGGLAIERCELQRRGDLAAEASPAIPAGALARVRERSSSSYHAETVELTTIADFPGLLLTTHCQRSARSLQLERRFGLLHHRTLRASTGGETGDRLRGPFVLAADEPGLPDLLVVPLQLGRYERFELRADGLVLVSKPEPGAVTRLGLWLLPRARAVAAMPHAVEVFRSLDLLPELPLGDVGTAELRSDLPIAWPRIVRLPRDARTPCLVRENGWWTWRGVQSTADGALLRVQHLPEDAVAIVQGPAVLARTRPGPGALGSVALRDPRADSVTVAVLQEGPIAQPSVTMGADFDEVTVDGKPWSHHRGRTVFLPPGIAKRTVATVSHGGGSPPHVAATSARLQHCAWDARARELVLVAASGEGRPPELPHTAVLAGPRPRAIEGGEIVDDASLGHASAAERAAAGAGGTMIRFLAGVVRVQYGE